MANYALERSTYLIRMRFKDGTGKLVSPDSVLWTLVDEDKNVINDREQVEVTSLDSSITITLHGDDLQIKNSRSQFEKRWVVVEATYTSDYGVALPLNDEHEFIIKNMNYIE